MKGIWFRLTFIGLCCSAMILVLWLWHCMPLRKVFSAKLLQDSDKSETISTAKLTVAEIFEKCISKSDIAEQDVERERKKNAEKYSIVTKTWDEGNPVAQYKEGLSYWYGIVFDENVRQREIKGKKAAEWSLKAAHQGVPAAQRLLGFLYLHGDGVAKDPREAEQWFLKAAEAGDSIAQLELGLFYEDGTGGVTNYAEAVKWLRKYAQNSPSVSSRCLWGYEINGTNVSRIAHIPDQELLRAAERGEMSAQYHWAQRLLYNRPWLEPISKHEEEQAVFWFLKAAQNGYVPAQYELACLYQEGLSWAKIRQAKQKSTSFLHINDKYRDDVKSMDGPGGEYAKRVLKMFDDIGTKSEYERGELGKPEVREREKAEAIRWYTCAAEQGWIQAQYTLGMVYKEGKLTAANPAEAINWFTKAAENGHTRAQYELAKLYKDDDSEEKDYAQAFRWFSAAAERGFAEAQYELAKMYEYGESVQKDHAKAVEWYKRSALRLYSPAFTSLGRMYYWGKGVEQNFSKATGWFILHAQSDSDKAWLYLAVMFENGEGVEQNLDEANKCYSCIATVRGGKADAHYELGTCYYFGTQRAVFEKSGVLHTMEAHQDYDEACFWFKKAANAGSLDAQNMLAEMFYNGEGVQQDYSEAFKWYQKAAAQGNVFAQYNLAVCYENGKGVSQNVKEAASWYLKAAEQGNALAQFGLGLAYYNGKGVSENWQEAVKWYCKAAEQGYAGAQANLGAMYQDGKGVPEDYIEAYKWSILAAAQGEEVAVKNRDILRGKMTKEQIMEAQRRAALWEKKPSSNKSKRNNL